MDWRLKEDSREEESYDDRGGLGFVWVESDAIPEIEIQEEAQISQGRYYIWF